MLGQGFDYPQFHLRRNMEIDFTPLVYLGAVVAGVPLFILGMAVGAWIW